MMIPSPLHAVLVGVHIKGSPTDTIQSIAELRELATTAGIVTVDQLIQERRSPHPKHYIGSGKLVELHEMVQHHCAQVIICDDELSPNQTRVLEQYFQLKVIDRTSLILDIFAQRALTYEAQLQVELAQLNYLMPRLTRLWTHLSRQSGGIGARGPGETQLETDKRDIRKRISHIKSKLLMVKNQRQLRREKREASQTLTIALVGYTNAGKSTLMNQLTASNSLAEDKLFATLDPISRRFTLPNGQDVILTDTVGFIQKLPHQLVNAFYSTLEEVTQADLLIHVIDSHHPNLDMVIKTASQIINTLNIHDTPVLYVFNKWDLISAPNTLKKTIDSFSPAVFISATHPDSFDTLYHAISTITDSFYTVYEWHIPYNKTHLMHLIREHGRLIGETHDDTGTTVKVSLTPVHADQIMNELFGP